MGIGRMKVTDHSPYLQLFMLIVFAVLGTVVFSVIALLICFVMYGFDLFNAYNDFVSGDIRFLNGLKIFQMVSTMGLFIVPPLLLSYFNGKQWNVFYGFKKPKADLLLVILLLVIFSMPLVEWTALLNQKMTLPGFLKPLEAWMREKEDASMELTIALLTVHKPWDIFVNLLMIALLPAIGEELFFRGGMQQVFIRIFKNAHIGIWVTAFIFSAIHVQFFGFLPRLLLGAAFGYLYVWSGSLWYPMLAHFINNGYVVAVSFMMQKNNLPLNSTEPTISLQWYGYIISFVLTITLFEYFKNKTAKINGEQLG